MAVITKTKLNQLICESVKRGLKEMVNGVPKTVSGRIKQIYRAVDQNRLSSMKYHDEHWGALGLYDEVISSLGYELSYWVEDGGYGDYDEYTHMPTSKTYNISISCGDSRDIDGYIKMMAAGSMEDPFDAYDTCIVLWPSHRK